MFWLCLLLSVISHAYIPEYATIAAHAADQHGKGAYQIEQEVTLRKDNESYTIKETWQIRNESEMRVTLEGRGPLKGLVSGTLVYQGNSRESLDSGFGHKSTRLSDDWLEPLFHFRSSRYFRQRLVNLKITPPESLHERPSLNSEGDPKWEPQNFLRLSRTGGSITWAIGANPPSANAPMLWLEQDQFVLRKIRVSDQSLLRADDYAKYEDGFWYPRSRTYTFGPYTVQMQTLQVKALGKLANNDSRFRAQSLLAPRDTLKLPDLVGFKEFYARFR